MGHFQLWLLPTRGFPWSHAARAHPQRVEWGLVEGSRDHLFIFVPPTPTLGSSDKLRPGCPRLSCHISPVLSPMTSQWPNFALCDTQVESYVLSLPSPTAPKGLYLSGLQAALPPDLTAGMTKEVSLCPAA